MEPISLAIIAAVGLVVNLVSTIWTNDTNQKIYEDSKQTAKENQEAQNLYNSPAEQAKRLKAAGLNPVAFIDNIGGAPMASVSPIAMQAPKIDISPFLQIAALDEQNELNDLKEEFMRNADLREEMKLFMASEEFENKLVKFEEEIKGLKLANNLKEEDLKALIKGFWSGNNVSEKAVNFFAQVVITLLKGRGR